MNTTLRIDLPPPRSPILTPWSFHRCTSCGRIFSVEPTVTPPECCGVQSIPVPARECAHEFGEDGTCKHCGWHR